MGTQLGTRKLMQQLNGKNLGQPKVNSPLKSETAFRVTRTAPMPLGVGRDRSGDAKRPMHASCRSTSHELRYLR